jgi:RNA polymerase sigma factor (sigma-70 family)
MNIANFEYLLQPLKSLSLDQEFFDTSIKFFDSLGYSTSRRTTSSNLLEKASLDLVEIFEGMNRDRALMNQWKKLHFLFQLTKGDIDFPHKTNKQKIDPPENERPEIQSYLFFSLELKGGKDAYNKKDLSKLAVEFNRAFMVPVLIMCKHGSTISLLYAHRRSNLLDPSKDVIEKVHSLIGIHTRFPSTSHLDLLDQFSLFNILQLQNPRSIDDIVQVWQEIFDQDETEFERGSSIEKLPDIITTYFNDLSNFPIMSRKDKFIYALHLDPLRIAFGDEFEESENSLVDITIRDMLDQFVRLWGFIYQPLFSRQDVGTYSIFKNAVDSRSGHYYFSTMAYELCESIKDNFDREIYSTLIRLLSIFVVLPIEIDTILLQMIDKRLSIIQDNIQKYFEAHRISQPLNYSEIKYYSVNAKNKLIQSHLRWAIARAKRRVGLGIDFCDLIQEANKGLMIALEKFDVSMGFQISTYATNWIDQRISRYLANQSRIIRLPVHLHNLIINLNRIKESLYQTLGKEPSILEIALESDFVSEELKEKVCDAEYNLNKINRVDLDHLQKAQKKVEDTFFYDLPVVELGHNISGCNSETGDFMIENMYFEVEDFVDKNLLKQEINNALVACLDPRDYKIVSLRFGLRLGDPQTLEQVAFKIGVTRERIRQIESKCLLKLRRYCRRNSIGLIDL